MAVQQKLSATRALVATCGDAASGPGLAEARAAALSELEALRDRVISSKKDLTLLEGSVDALGEAPQQENERVKVEKKLFEAKAALNELASEMSAAAREL